MWEIFTGNATNEGKIDNVVSAHSKECKMKREEGGYEEGEG